MIVENPLGLVKNTPLLRIRGFGIPPTVQVYAKLEMYNPSGGVKDRVGTFIVDAYIAQGILKPGMTIVDASAGNAALAIAFAVIGHNIKTIFVIPDKFAVEKRTLLRALGATVIETPGALGMQYASKVASELCAQTANAISIQQFDNPLNVLAHRSTTAVEIMEDLDNIDVFVCGGGSCGTFMGVALGLQAKFPHLKPVLVDPIGSVIGQGERGAFHIEGIGNAFIPPIFDANIVDQVFKIHQSQAEAMTRQIAAELGLFVGVSSGANLYATVELAKTMTTGTLVTIFFDRAERYFSQNIYGEQE